MIFYRELEMTKIATAKQSALPFMLFCSVLMLALIAHTDLLVSKHAEKPAPALKLSTENPAPELQPVLVSQLKQS